MRRSAVLILFVWSAASVVRSEEAIDYVRQVKPLFKLRCVACHGSLKQKNGLRLDTATLARRGGSSGEAIVPGKSDESLLVEHLTGANGLKRMPPEGEPLTAAEITLIKSWIDQGAKAPDESPDADPTGHWSYVPPVRPAVPDSAGRLIANPIDAFLTAELSRRGLEPLTEAPRHTLLRRLYLDLIGLPPTPAQQEAFLEDTSSDAYEKVVDQLLASPHYGERWGRHWMDVWRYSDWDGFGAEVRESQPHIWRWRDWIIESLNTDTPYDRMVQSMVAGDELAPDDPQTVRATGFLVRNWYLFNRNVWLDASVEHTSKAFLGVTVNCARCHDHMYDPIAQSDYYRMRAFFEPHDIRIDRVQGETDTKKDGLVRVYDAKAETPTFLFHRGEEKQPDKDHPLTPGVPEVLTLKGSNPLPEIAPVILPGAAFYPGSRDFEQATALANADADQTRLQMALTMALTARDAAARTHTEWIARRDIPVPPPDFVEDFSILRPDVWTYGAGTWQTHGSRLSQTDSSESQSPLFLQAIPPRDFVLRLRFRTTGGKTWKSVGFGFDRVDEANYDSVYVSGYAGGPRVQVSHRRNGVDTYPAEAAKAVPVELNRDYELTVLVRDRQLNVGLDGKLLVVYTLPAERRVGGGLSLWTFDATAEFVSLSIDGLEPTIALATAVDQPLPGEPTAESVAENLRRAEDAVRVAEQALAIGRAAREFVQARIAADNARFAIPPATDAGALATAAGVAERRMLFAQAERAVVEATAAVASLKITPATTDAAKKAVTDAEAALTKAIQARDAAFAATKQSVSEYTPSGPKYAATSTGRRLALARWITARTNPLTARVAVNHIWLRHFNQPLVPSVFDFGLNGKPPTHPALLDWLAVELMDSGWKMKPLHRLIVTSEAYRRSSGGDPARDESTKNSAIDPENVWLWRMTPRRLEAEIVRDCTLAAAGSLDPAPFGPDLDQNAGMTVSRRSVYFRSAKEKKMTFLALFDSANVVECYRRSESVVPQQALAMANSPLALAQSRLLAKRLTEEAGRDGSRRFLDLAFAHVLCRPPADDELSECLQFLATQSQRFTKAGLTSFTSGDATNVPPSADPDQRARENLIHVLLNHNDFVTVR